MSQTPQTVTPEFVDHQGLTRMFGIRRSFAYVLVERGCIKSVSITKPGKQKGKRLFDVASVRSFLNNAMREGGAK